MKVDINWVKMSRYLLFDDSRSYTVKENLKQQSKSITELINSVEAGWPEMDVNKLQHFHEFGTAGHHYFKDAFDICQLFHSTFRFTPI